MISAWLSIILGFFFLMFSADRLINGASVLARSWGWSPMMIGLTIVALGTSAPEVVVAVVAAWHQQTALAIGNVVGSNIANIGLVLGVTVCIMPLAFKRDVVKREFVVLVLVSVSISLLLWQGNWGRLGSSLALLALAILGGLSLKSTFSRGSQTSPVDVSGQPYATRKAWVALFVGLIGLPLSSHFVVEGAVAVAYYFHVSELIVGLTIIAFGTSLPELAASVAGAVKGQPDLAMGNILGSNILNLLLVLPLAGLVAPSKVEPIVVWRDCSVMVGLSLLLWCYCAIKRTAVISRLMGIILVALFVGYWVVLVRQATVI